MVELAAPAGEPDAVAAAVNHGADAVYLGLGRFNARARAGNFTLEQLRRTVDELRPRGVKVYLTVNTLVFDRELRDVAQLVGDGAAAGVDAIIVQDLGVARVARSVCPELPLHASTQTSVGTAAGCDELARLGISRLVVPRELDLDAIRRLRARTDLELEVFVHGAQCLSWSGQCLASLSRGGRSGNRGNCAQPCRLPRQLLVDGEPQRSEAVRHPLSPGDLWAVDHLEALVAAGVDSFKIEGRLKRPEYVASAVHHYRLLLDRIEAGGPAALDAGERRDLLQPFHRSPSPGYLDGGDHRRLVEGHTPGGTGLEVGHLDEVAGDRVLVIAAPRLMLEAGDGLAVEGPITRGGRVRSVDVLVDGRLRVRMGPEFQRGWAAPGQRVTRTESPGLSRRLRLGIEGRSRAARPRRHPVIATLDGAVGQSLVLTLEDGEGGRVATSSAHPLPPARTHPLTRDAATARLGKMGESPFRLDRLQWRVRGAVSIPPAELNRLRRDACAALVDHRRRLPHRPVDPAAPLPTNRAAREVRPREGLPPADPRPDESELSRARERDAPALLVLCRTEAQVEATLREEPGAAVAVESQDPGVADLLVRRIRDAGRFAVMALPRTAREGEPVGYRWAESADGLLVRTLGQLGWLVSRRETTRVEGPVLLGDASLNAVNEVAATHLLARGLDTLLPGTDLDGEGIVRLASRLPPGRLEGPLLTRWPLFHTAHCLFAARIGGGAASRAECGDVCRSTRLAVRDPGGRACPVLPDALCRNTVFAAESRSYLGHLALLRTAGVTRFRVELVDEDGESTRAVLRRVRNALSRAGLEPSRAYPVA